MKFLVEWYYLAIVGVDMVFGWSWMQSLGRALTNYNNLMVEFIFKEQHVTLYVETLLHSKPLNSHTMRKLVATDNVGIVLHLQLVPVSVDVSQDSLQAPIQNLLQGFDLVF